MPGEYKFFLRQIGKSFPALLDHLSAAGLPWFLQALLITLVILAADYATGAGILRLARVTVAPRFRPLAFLLTGLAAQGLALLALGFAGLLNTMAVGALTLLPGLAAAPLAWRQRPRFRISWLLLPVALIFLADWFQPVAETDSTMYHMAAARQYRDAQSLPYQPDVRFNAQPQSTVLWYLRHWLLTGRETGIKPFNLELLALLALAIRVGWRELRVRRSGLTWAALAASPVFVWTTKIEYADLALTACVTAAGVLLLASLRRRSMTLALLGGLALALAGSVKLQGLVVAACLGGAFVVGARRWPWRRLAITLAGIAALVVLLDGGWWWRSWYSTGSPAHPFFTREADLERLLEVNQRYGFGHGLEALVKLPWRVFREPPVKFADAYSFGPGLMLLAAALPGLVRRRKGGFFALALVAFFGFWFFSGQVTRYWASTLGLQALLIAAAFDGLPFHRSLTVVLALAGVVNVLITSPALRLGWPPPGNAVEQDAVQTATLPYWRAIRAVNAAAVPTDRVYLLYAEEAKFHLRTRHAGGWFGPHSYFWLALGARSDAEVLARLRAAGFRYLVLHRARGAEHAEMFSYAFATSALRVAGPEGPPGVTRIHDDGGFVVWRLEP